MSFPKSPQRAAYETFINVLMTNPLLKREFATFIAWSGTPKDQELPSSANLPYLRLTPHPSTKRSDYENWEDTEHRRADISIDVLLALPGTNAGDLMDAWDAVVRSIYPKDPDQFAAIERRLYDAGVISVELPIPALEPVTGGKDGLALEAKGTILLEFQEKLRST